MRPVLLFTIATPASIPGVLPKLLENLANFVSDDQVDQNGNRGTTLAEHTIVGSTNMETQLACDRLHERFHQKCYELDHGFNQDVHDNFEVGRTRAHAYSLGLSRIKTLVDLVSMGFDVLYFDLHHFFFQNPLRYMYYRTKAPIVVSPTPSSTCNPLAVAADGTLPDGHHRLDIAFLRSNPATFRCLYNWLYWSSHAQHDVHDKPLDHHTFRTVVQECVRSLSTAVMTVEYLNPTHFPADCSTKCGCSNTAAATPGPDGSCAKDVMSEWVGYLFSCSGNAGNLEASMAKYGDMYRGAGLTIKH